MQEGPVYQQQCVEPEGLKYLDNWISEDEHHSLLAAIDLQPWLRELSRRVQHYGYRYDYKARKADPSMYLGPLPTWALQLADRLSADGLMEQPDQMIVNEYLPGQGIASHIDCLPCFGPIVASLSLGAACVMELSRNKERIPLFLHPRSLLVLAGDARNLWRHGIPARRSDTWDGVRQLRDRRVSMTFRTMRRSAE